MYNAFTILWAVALVLGILILIHELGHFIAVLESALGREARKRYLPMQPGDVPITYADVERLARVTGFSPRTTIEEGIPRFVKWYRHYHC